MIRFSLGASAIVAVALSAASLPASVLLATTQVAVAGDTMNMTDVTLGDLTISGAFARATLPNAPVGGGYVTITNAGTEDDTLIAASSPVAGQVQLHEMSMQGDVMKMAELPDGIPVPAGETVTLKPGGLHLMFMQLKEPMVEGSTVPVTLTFAKAGTVTVDLAIAGSAATMPAMEQH